MFFSELLKLIEQEEIPVYTVSHYRAGETETRCIHPANCCNNIYSVSKNFTATAVGMLYDRGLLPLDTSVYELFHQDYPADCGEDWKAVTVAHVLAQTIGITSGFLDIDAEDIRQYPTDDFLRMVLRAPLVYRPGEKMVYSDSNYYLASRIVAAVSGKKLQDFLLENLFNPLCFQGTGWATCPRGHAMGATGLFIRTEEMLRFGALYLNGGMWEGRRLLSEDWVAKATASQVGLESGSSYGYSFWRLGGESSAYHCAGMYGQVIYVDPRDRCVFAWQAYDPADRSGKLVAALYAR